MIKIRPTFDFKFIQTSDVDGDVKRSLFHISDGSKRSSVISASADKTNLQKEGTLAI